MPRNFNLHQLKWFSSLTYQSLQVKAEREAPDSIEELQKNTEAAAKESHSKDT